MSKLLDRARELRLDPHVHYNCAQSVLIPFCEQLGYPMELGLAMAAHFGSGMRVGGTCGAMTGGLMALGLLGADGGTAQTFLRRMRENHEGLMNCADLLRRDREKGNTARKPHCDGMVYEAIALIEELTAQKN